MTPPLNPDLIPTARYKTKFSDILSAHRLPEAKSLWGHVTHISGQSVQIEGLSAFIGLGGVICVGHTPHDGLHGEVISLEGHKAIAMMYGNPAGLKVGARAYYLREELPHPSQDWVGRVLNYEGKTVTGERPISGVCPAPLKASPPEAILRKALGPRLPTGVTAIDTFLPLCEGQRMGLFAGSGVGKSTLLAALAKGGSADVNIVALIGERGREVRSFVEDTLGAEGMKKSIIFVATSNEASAIKLRTALLAMATAEYFRDQGQQVLFLFDSLTRYAEAHRDVALTAGEVPSLRAFPPSTFSALAALCERAGPGIDSKGDITAVFSVLVAGSNMEEPIADMVRGILDGHIILDRDIAERGRYPAINIPKSVSRSLPEAANAEENKNLISARKYITQYEDSRTLIQAGLYVNGTDRELDKAIAIYAQLDGFIGAISAPDISASFSRLKAILDQSELGTTKETEEEPSLTETIVTSNDNPNDKYSEENHKAPLAV